MTFRVGRIGALLLLILVTPMSAVGQAFQDASFSFLLGGVADAREDNLPFSPYLGFRAKGAVHPNVWFGLELGSSFVTNSNGCVTGFGGGGCSGFEPYPVPRVSSSVHVEAGGERLRPYVEGIAGVGLTGGSSIIGVGFGLRFPGFLLENGMSLELRRLAEEDDQGRSLDRWEAVFGLHMR